MAGKKSVLMNIRISQEEKERLEYLCMVTGMTKSDFIRDAINLKDNIMYFENKKKGGDEI